MASNNISHVGLKCTGCSACADACPVDAIQMIRGEDGFSYPYIDAATCISCGKCLKVCPTVANLDFEPISKMYAAFSKDAGLRSSSSSGGMFATCARYVLASGGVVVGASIDEFGKVSHCVVEDEAELCKLQKSKYVQSETTGIYREVRSFLDSGRRVLFSGCPCQVAGLKTYLGRDYSNLITMDLICHGVPSPGVWEEHVRSITGGRPASCITFRRKDFTARTTYSVDVCAPGIKYKGRDEFDDPYMALFVTGSANRESCYSCSFACSERVSDITVGDCASSNCYPEFYPWVQLSSVSPVTDKGRSFWHEVHDQFISIQIDHEREIRLNAQLSAPCRRTELRDSVYQTISSSGLEVAAEPVTPRRTFKMMLKRVAKFLIPNSVRGRLIQLKAKINGR